MALANVAAILAQRGKRVLALDFDFEAPGLHRYFLTKGSPTRYVPHRSQLGVINFFSTLQERLQKVWPDGEGFQEAESQSRLSALFAETFIPESYVYQIQVQNPNTKGASLGVVDFVPAARFDQTYAHLVREFDWQDFYDSYAEVFPAFAAWLGQRYDYVLIDSRTGVTDIGSICTMMMPDKLVLAFTPNEQSLRGAIDAGWQAVQGRKESPAARQLPIFPLISRVDEGEEEQKRDWMTRVRESFEELFREIYGLESCDLEAYFNAIRIPHRSFYAYGERIAVEEQQEIETGSLAQAFSQLADGLACMNALEARDAIVQKSNPDKARLALLPDMLFKSLEILKLFSEGRSSEAIRDCDNVLKRLAATDVSGLAEVQSITGALLNAKAHQLDLLNQHQEAITTYQEIVQRFSKSTIVAQRMEAARADFNIGHQLLKMRRLDEALEVIDRVLNSFEKDNYDARAQEGIARTLVAKGTILADMSRDNDAIAAYDRVINEFSSASDPVAVTQVIKAMTNKGASLAKLGKDTMSIQLRGEIVRRFRSASVEEHREAVSVAWAGKIASLQTQKHLLESLSECEELLREFGNSHNPKILPHVATTILFKGTALEHVGRVDDAMKCYDDLIAQFGDATALELQKPVAHAMYYKSAHFREDGQYDAARAIDTDMLRRFGSGPDGSARNLAANLLISDINTTKSEGQPERTLSLCEAFLSFFSNTMDLSLRTLVWNILTVKGHALRELTRYKEAAASFESVYEYASVAPGTDTLHIAHDALNSAGFALLCEAKQVLLSGNENAGRALLQAATAKFSLALTHSVDNPIVLGNAGYTSFLLGKTDEAYEFLAKAISLGGTQIRKGELDDAAIHPLPQDDDFRALLASIPDPTPQST
jgi:tetratricopeptide (TPR) repeat protein